MSLQESPEHLSQRNPDVSVFSLGSHCPYPAVEGERSESDLKLGRSADPRGQAPSPRARERPASLPGHHPCSCASGSTGRGEQLTLPTRSQRPRWQRPSSTKKSLRSQHPAPCSPNTPPKSPNGHLRKGVAAATSEMQLLSQASGLRTAIAASHLCHHFRQGRVRSSMAPHPHPAELQRVLPTWVKGARFCKYLVLIYHTQVRKVTETPSL